MRDSLLLAELDNDPETIGYDAAGWTGTPPTPVQYQAVADLINAKTRSENQDVSGTQLFVAIKGADFQAIYNGNNDGAKAYLDNLFRLDIVPLKNAGVRTAIQAIFAGKTDTLNAITALLTRPVSRAVEIGVRKRVDVGDLRRLKGDVS